jgi:hypothetical protein
VGERRLEAKRQTSRELFGTAAVQVHRPPFRRSVESGFAKWSFEVRRSFDPVRQCLALTESVLSQVETTPTMLKRKKWSSSSFSRPPRTSRPSSHPSPDDSFSLSSFAPSPAELSHGTSRKSIRPLFRLFRRGRLRSLQCRLSSRRHLSHLVRWYSTPILPSCKHRLWKLTTRQGPRVFEQRVYRLRGGSAIAGGVGGGGCCRRRSRRREGKEELDDAERLKGRKGALASPPSFLLPR